MNQFIHLLQTNQTCSSEHSSVLTLSLSHLHEKTCMWPVHRAGIFVNHASFLLQRFFLMAFPPVCLDWDTEAAWATMLLITADSWLLSCDCVLKTCHENIYLKQLFLPSCLLAWWIFESVWNMQGHFWVSKSGCVCFISEHTWTHENDTHSFTVTLSSIIIGILNEWAKWLQKIEIAHNDSNFPFKQKNFFYFYQKTLFPH